MSALNLRLREIMEANSFDTADLLAGKPHIFVFRNTGLYQDGNGEWAVRKIADTGDNICDTIVLSDETAEVPLRGRSYPHMKYQKEQLDGISACNYIATGHYPTAWQRGFHRGFMALVQSQAFTIWRSKDLKLHTVDDDGSDDYMQTGIVADNFHGFAPWSAGCVTVLGAMGYYDGPNKTPIERPEEDWAMAIHWIYQIHPNDPYFSAVILDYEDIEAAMNGSPRLCLRIGSRGPLVQDLQAALKKIGYNVNPDGVFGPITHELVRNLQRGTGLFDDGVATANLGKAIETITHGGAANNAAQGA